MSRWTCWALLSLTSGFVGCGEAHSDDFYPEHDALAESAHTTLPETLHLAYLEGSTELHYLKADQVRLRASPDGMVLNGNSLGLRGDALRPTGRTEQAGSYLWVEGDLERKSGILRGWAASVVLAKAKTQIDTSGPRTIVVNLVNNRAYYLEDGALQRQWNVGSGRNLDGNRTPSGTFEVKVKDECPPYSSHGVSYAGCAPDNPLGPKALWFHGGHLYGLHGTTAPILLAEGTTAPSRRVSGGCVRNVDSDIEWLFERAQVGDKVVVEYFDADAVFGSRVGDEPAYGRIECPTSYRLQSINAGGGRLCINDTNDAWGPFTRGMVDKCLSWGGGDACHTDRWARDLAVAAYGGGKCPAGATQDAKTGYCVEGSDGFGPFPRAMIDVCIEKGGGEAACNSARWNLGFMQWIYGLANPT